MVEKTSAWVEVRRVLVKAPQVVPDRRRNTGRCLGRQVFQVLTECQRAVKLDPEVHRGSLKLESVVVDYDVELVACLSVV